MKRYFVISLLAVLLLGCAKNTPQPPALIMEGWIDAGGNPVVLIHKSYVLDAVSDSDTTLEQVAEKLMIPFGKVTVSDGSEEVVLTGRLDTMYMPPYTYTSLDMTGCVGKTYTFTAKYNELYATATTTIPPVAYLDSLTVRSASEEIVDIRAYIAVPDSDDNAYYAFFIRKAKDKQFMLCPFSVCESRDAVDGKLEIKLYNPVSDSENSEATSYYFHKDTSQIGSEKSYQLKLARLDYASCQFWRAYNEQVITRGILFVPVYKNIPGNVQGGYGNVSGMGSSFYLFNISRDTTYRF